MHAACVLLEPLVLGRRAVVVGAADSGVAELLVSLGARTVYVYDPDADRVRRLVNHPAGVSLRPWPTSEPFDVRDGAFDVAVVSDVNMLQDARMGSASAALARLRRLVAEGGCLAVVAPNEEETRTPAGRRHVDYYELYDLVAVQFPYVSMVAAVPFEGVTLAALGAEEASGARIDTQLIEARPAPSHFLAVGGDRPVDLEGYVVVQLPPRAAHDDAVEAPPKSGPQVAVDDSVLTAQQAALAEATLRVELLDGQLSGLKGDFTAAQTRIRQLEAELRSAREDVRLRLEELAEVRRALGVLEGERIEAERALQELETMRERFATVCEEGHKRTQEVARLNHELSRLSEAHEAEVAQYEAVMRERAQAIQLLETELRRRHRMVQELVDALEEARGEGAHGGVPARAFEEVHAQIEPLRRESASLRQAADRLEAQLRAAQEQVAAQRRELELARREAVERTADAEALAWRVQELEGELAEAHHSRSAQPDATPGESRPSPRDADELDALRLALAQEHAARARAESGEGLREAHDEIARHKAMIAQLTRELEAVRASVPLPPPEWAR
jgi:chromosome segregation ATPase